MKLIFKFYGDEDYEDSSEDEDDDDDYLEADWSFYKETMNVNQGAKREYQQMVIIRAYLSKCRFETILFALKTIAVFLLIISHFSPKRLFITY